MENFQYEIKKDFFNKGFTKTYNFRMEQLANLYNAIKANEDKILNALKLDLHKPEFEAYSAEIGIVYNELKTTMKNLKKLMRPVKVATPIYLQPSKSYIFPEPKGVVMIVSPWNYPFQLAISPLIGAIAAGNCILLKASSKSYNTQKIISKIISEAFEEKYISTIDGENSSIVESLIVNNRFDHIFFTGSVNVGKKIMSLASNNLTSVTLELGGKSPVIVHSDADLELAARRITWAKFYNAGQTCIAPDYLLVHESAKKNLVKNIQKNILAYYGVSKNENIARIINEERFNKLVSLLENKNIIDGGIYNKSDRYIAPTLIDDVSLDDDIMKEEIFGPLLPIIVYKEIEEVISVVRKNPYPLALYLFTKDGAIEKHIIESIQFGGGCINDAFSHVINPNLPFGGVGYSGTGRYHGKYSFYEFSHKKSIIKTKGKFPIDIKLPPYSDIKLKLVKKFL